MAGREIGQSKDSLWDQSREEVRTSLGLGEAGFYGAAKAIGTVNGEPTLFGGAVTVHLRFR